MSVPITLKSIISCKDKITKELEKNVDKKRLVFYRIDGNIIYLPYYYARTLILDASKPFEDAIKQLDISKVNINNNNFKKIEFKLNFELLPKQVEIMAKCMEMLKRYNSLTLEAATGFGKSNAIVYMTNNIGLLSVVIASKLIFINNLIETYKMFSNAVIWSPSDKKPKCPPDVQVIIVTPGCFSYIPEDIRKSVGFLLLDESHQLCTINAIKPILSVHPKYIVNCSATPVRDDEMHIFLSYLCGPYKVISPLETPVRIIKLETGIRIPLAIHEGKLNWIDHLSFLAADELRNKLIVSLCAQIISNDPENMIIKILNAFTKPSPTKSYKIILLLGKIDGWLEPLQKMFDSINITHDYMDSTKKTYNDCDVLIGTRAKLGTGFDQKTGCSDYKGIRINTVIDVSTTKQAANIMQNIGRGCRAEVCYYITLIDLNSMIAKHYIKSVQPFIDSHKDVEVCTYKPKLYKEISKIMH